MSLSLTADTAVCPSVQLGKVFHVQMMPAHIPRGKFHQSSCVSESTWQWDLGRGHTEYRVEVVLYPVSLCKVRGSQDIKDSITVSDLDSVDSNTPPPLQREGVCQKYIAFFKLLPFTYLYYVNVEFVYPKAI